MMTGFASKSSGLGTGEGIKRNKLGHEVIIIETGGGEHEILFEIVHNKFL